MNFSLRRATALPAMAMALALANFVGTAGAAPLVNLNGLGYVQYGDGQSYSLPFAIIDQCGGTASGCQYSVDSTPGAIKNLVVLATGADGAPLLTNFSGMDDAYSTPSGVSGSIFFSPSASTNNGVSPVVINNNPNTWDSSLLALKTFLAGGQLVTFFNNNQTNSGGSATQSLAAWAQISITDAGGAVVGVYDFTNRNSKYDVFTNGGGGTFLGDVTTYTSAGIGNPIAGNNTNTDYVLSGGAICRNVFGIPVPCGSLGALAPVAHNLGADHAAYAILFPELNAQLTTLFAGQSDAVLAQYTLHADVRLGCDPSITGGAITSICTGNDPTVPYGRSLNNGYEQIFIAAASPLGCAPTDPTCNPVPVPEPGTLLLVSLAMFALPLVHGRRKMGQIQPA